MKDETSASDGKGTKKDWHRDALCISTDGIRRTVAWKLKDYGENGALSHDQMGSLANRFSLPQDQLRELSRLLGEALGSLPTCIFISRSKAIAEGNAEIATAMKEMGIAEKKLHSAATRLAALHVNAYADSQAQSDFRVARDGLKQCQEYLRVHQKMLEGAAPSPELVYRLRPENAKNVRDYRRDRVLLAIMQVWHDSGRKLTFTTDPITSERRGVLVDFVQAVVGCVTDPPGILGGESIVAGIVDGKKFVEELASFLEERKKGYRPTWTD